MRPSEHITTEPAEKPPEKRRLHFFWLILPWLTVGALFFAESSGFRRWLFKLLPSELSTIAQNNVGWGILLVTFGSSFRWAYLRWNDRSLDSFKTWVLCSFVALGITAAHVSIAAGILFAGCMVIMWS